MKSLKIQTLKEKIMTKVSFIGLGVMGFPMAGHLSNAGHEVNVYNRTSKSQKSGN